MNGVVKWFNDPKGYGFILTESGKEVFVHYSEILDTGFKTLAEGQNVTFECFETPKGLLAKGVVKL